MHSLPSESRLTLLKMNVLKDKGVWKSLYRCSCGTEIITQTYYAKTGNSLSCGCLTRERTSESRRTHGLTGSRVYRIWSNMWTRCENTKTRVYQEYGARGIKVCERWGKFERFLEDMGHPPDGYSIDRIDSKGNYEPGNCRWASPKQQCRNLSTNIWHTMNGKTMCIKDWCEELGINNSTVCKRIKRGMSTLEALMKDLPAFEIEAAAAVQS